MPYNYSFDTTTVGNFWVYRETYVLIQQGLQRMKEELNNWNRRALQAGARVPPYEKEVSDLDRMIEWGQQRLDATSSPHEDIIVNSISVGSLRYLKAALLMELHAREKEREDRAQESWPEGALRALDEGIDFIRSKIAALKVPPSDVLWELIPRPRSAPPQVEGAGWDVFICHASEDKDDFVRPLAEALRERGLRVWFDEFTLRVGDSLRRSIDRGLRSSTYGVVVISPNFLAKDWPQRELDGLVALEVEGRKVILPVWHNIDVEGVRRYSPTLADRVAVSSRNGINHIVNELLRAMHPPGTEPPSL